MKKEFPWRVYLYQAFHMGHTWYLFALACFAYFVFFFVR